MALQSSNSVIRISSISKRDNPVSMSDNERQQCSSLSHSPIQDLFPQAPVTSNRAFLAVSGIFVGVRQVTESVVFHAERQAAMLRP